MTAAPTDAAKRNAARAAVAEVEDGMLIGLGTGSTAVFAIEALGERVAAGLRVSAVPTSEATAVHARRLGIPLIDLDVDRRLDLTIDGADEVERGTLDLIKGRGGALLREKIVATAGRRMSVIVDEAKLVDRLGRGPLPVEIVPFGWPCTIARLAAAGVAPVLRQSETGGPFVTDGGHYIADCSPGPIEDAECLDRQISALTGVIETGLFIGIATRIFVGSPTGVTVIEP
jgi:ribose 5-phosphate isomerase A